MAGANHTLEGLFTALDPKSLILSQYSATNSGGGGGEGGSDQPHLLELTTTESFVMERGPRYKAYADLRESNLRLKHMRDNELNDSPTPLPPPPKKQVKFQGNLIPACKGSFSSVSASSVLTQSVQDFSSALRKENRKPPAGSSLLPPTPMMVIMEKSATPPPAGTKGMKMYGKLGGTGSGSKSVNAGDKRAAGGLMARRSYANVEELRSLSLAAANAINGDNKRTGRGVVSKTVMGSRQY